MSRPFQRLLFDMPPITAATIPNKGTTTYEVLCHLLLNGTAHKYECQHDTGRAASDYRKDISVLVLEHGWRIEGEMGSGVDPADGRLKSCKSYWIDNDWLAGVMAGSEQVAAFVRMTCWPDAANDSAHAAA